MLISAIDLRFNPFNVFDFGLTGVFLFIDSIVYWFVAQLFKLFVAVAGVSLPIDVYQKIASNMEVIIGVFALFYLAYALLRALVNPDELQKQTPKIVGNLVISLVLLGVTPMIFDYAMKLQNLIISENIIGNLIYGQDKTTDIESAGYLLAFTSLETFLTVPDKVEGTNILYIDEQDGQEKNLTWGLLKMSIIKNKQIENIRSITQWVEPVHSRTLGCDYIPIFSTICGCVLIYVIFSFCLDMGLRVAKMAFYRIISPIPILMRIIPAKKSFFDTWLKESIGTFVEVFIRLFIIQIGIFLVDVIINSNVLEFNQTAGKIGLLGNMVIILGIMAFIKVAPKKFSEMLGIKSDFKIGIGGKLQASGAYGLAAMAGGGVLAGLRGFTGGIAKSGNAWRNFKDHKSVGNFAKLATSFIGHGFGGVLSGAAGGVSAAARSASGGFKAKNLKELQSAAAKGIEGAAKAREKRENYRASHGGYVGAFTGHVGDLGHSFTQFVGLGATLEGLKHESELVSAVSSARKAMADAAEAEINKKINKFHATSVVELNDGTHRGFTNLAEIDNALERIRNSGSYTSSSGELFTEADLVNLQQARTDLKDKLVESYLNGVDLDRTSATYGTQDRANIAGPVQEAIAAYHTNLKNNIGAITRNLTAEDLANPTISAWKANIEAYLNDTRNMDIKNIMGNASYDMGKLAEEVKKFAGTAQTNVNTRVNEYRQEEARRNGNNNS